MPSGKGAAIAPGTGKLAIRWSTKVKRKRVLIASANATVRAGKKTSVKVKLTKAGRKLLKRSKRLKVTTKVTFTPSGGHSVTATNPSR